MSSIKPTCINITSKSYKCIDITSFVPTCITITSNVPSSDLYQEQYDIDTIVIPPTPQLSGVSEANENTTIQITIGNLDTSFFYYINTSINGGAAHAFDPNVTNLIGWDLPEVSADTVKTLTVWANKDGQNSLHANHDVLVKNTRTEVAEFVVTSTSLLVEGALACSVILYEGFTSTPAHTIDFTIGSVATIDDLHNQGLHYTRINVAGQSWSEISSGLGGAYLTWNPPRKSTIETGSELFNRVLPEIKDAVALAGFSFPD